MRRLIFNISFCFCLLLTWFTFSGCRDGNSEQIPSVSSNDYQVVDADRLRSSDHQWCQVGNEELSWRFSDSSVEISSSGEPLPAEIVSEVLSIAGEMLNALGDHWLAPADAKVRKITASWELVDEDRKIRLFDMKVDGTSSSSEIELPIAELGESQLSIGAHKYIIRALK